MRAVTWMRSPTLNTVYRTEDRSDDFCLMMAASVALRSGDAMAFGHTHKPWPRVVEGIHVIYTGSVGRPKDGDWRAGYVRLDSVRQKPASSGVGRSCGDQCGAASGVRGLPAHKRETGADVARGNNESRPVYVRAYANMRIFRTGRGDDGKAASTEGSCTLREGASEI